MKQPESMTVSIPAFNEEETLDVVAQEALTALKKLADDYELLLVNDGSTDRTGQIMDRLKKQDRHIRVIHHKKNMGFTGAITTSLFSALKELVFLAPADGQFHFNELKRFVKAIRGHDVAVGYRTYNSEPLIRKIQSWVFHTLNAILLGIHLKGYAHVSMWRRHVLQNIQVTSDPRSNNAFPEIVIKSLKKGYKFTEVPISWFSRRGGEPKGKINLRIIFSTLVEMIKLWWSVRNGKVF